VPSETSYVATVAGNNGQLYSVLGRSGSVIIPSVHRERRLFCPSVPRTNTHCRPSATQIIHLTPYSWRQCVRVVDWPWCRGAGQSTRGIPYVRLMSSVLQRPAPLPHGSKPASSGALPACSFRIATRATCKIQIVFGGLSAKKLIFCCTSDEPMRCARVKCNMNKKSSCR